MTQRFVMFLGGGVMAGVFSAGVLTKLMEEDVYDELEAVYGTSVGPLNGSYFLTKQPEGRLTYFEDLTSDFIFPKNIPVSFWQHLSGKVKNISMEKRKNTVDLDYLFNIIQSERPLEMETLQEQSIPLYTRVLNTNTWEVEYYDLRKCEQPFRMMKASVALLPYYTPAPEIDGTQYMDAGVKDAIGLQYLLDKHPNKHVLLVLNHPPRSVLPYVVKNCFEGLVSNCIHKGLLRCYTGKQFRRQRDINRAEANERVTVIYPENDMDCGISTRDTKILRRTYQHGRDRIQNFLRDVL